MDIFDQAMAIEQQGAEFYQALADDAPDEGSGYIFSWLVEQERKHFAIFKKMKASGALPAGKSSDLKGVREIFVGWKDARARLNIKADQVKLYLQALEVEEKSVRLYEDAARAADDDAVRQVFLRIAAEEKAHRQIMENIIEFVSKPEIWVENAEFGYRGEDYYL